MNPLQNQATPKQLLANRKAPWINEANQVRRSLASLQRQLSVAGEQQRHYRL